MILLSFVATLFLTHGNCLGTVKFSANDQVHQSFVAQLSAGQVSDHAASPEAETHTDECCASDCCSIILPEPFLSPHCLSFITLNRPANDSATPLTLVFELSRPPIV